MINRKDNQPKSMKIHELQESFISIFTYAQQVLRHAEFSHITQFKLHPKIIGTR